MKTLMILGGGIYQVPLIERARAMGIRTVAVSIPGPYPGLDLADEALLLDTTDSEAVLESARRLKIDGICTAGTDVAVRTLGHVNDALGLKGISEEAAVLATDKLRMKECFEANGVRTARYRRVTFTQDPVKETAELTYPLIVKIVDSSGSRGITRVDRPEELTAAVEEARRCTHKDYYLIEEFIEGREFGAQAFVLDGQVKFILPHGDYVFHGATGVPAGHFAPLSMGEAELRDCLETAERAIRAMKLDNCAVNCDFIERGGKTYVLELGGRSGATCLSELVSIYYGFDYYEKMIETALGGSPDLPLTGAQPNASRLLMSDTDGIVEAVDLGGAAEDPDVVEIRTDVRPGDRVRRFHVGPDRIGHVVTKGATPEEAEEALDRAMARISIRVRAEA